MTIMMIIQITTFLIRLQTLRVPRWLWGELSISFKETLSHLLRCSTGITIIFITITIIIIIFIIINVLLLSITFLFSLPCVKNCICAKYNISSKQDIRSFFTIDEVRAYRWGPKSTLFMPHQLV